MRQDSSRGHVSEGEARPVEAVSVEVKQYEHAAPHVHTRDEELLRRLAQLRTLIHNHNNEHVRGPASAPHDNMHMHMRPAEAHAHMAASPQAHAQAHADIEAIGAGVAGANAGVNPNAEGVNAAGPAAGVGDDAAAADFDGLAQQLRPRQQEIQALNRVMETSLPFVTLIVIVFLLEHYQGIFMYVAFLGIWMRVDQAVAAQRAKKEDLDRIGLLLLMVISVLHGGALMLVFPHVDLLNALLLRAPKERLPFLDIVCVAAANELFVRFVTSAIDCVLLVISTSFTLPRLKKISGFNRALGFTYRSILPIPLWYTYFRHVQAPQVVQLLFSYFYLSGKATVLLPNILRLGNAASAAFSCQPSFGKYVTREEVMESGTGDGSCSICFNTLEMPVRLSCNHVYCESCISQWLEQNSTCPMCREQIQPNALAANVSPLSYTPFQIF